MQALVHFLLIEQVWIDSDKTFHLPAFISDDLDAQLFWVYLALPAAVTHAS